MKKAIGEGQSQMKRNYYNQIFRLVLPIALQNLLSAAVSSADVIMLNYVGQSAISAVSLASQYTSVLFMVFYGLGTGATMLCSQYYGKKDYQAIRAVEGIALRFSIPAALVFALLAFFFPTQVMTVFTNESELIVLGAQYLRLLGVAYLCWGLTEVYLAVLRSIGKVKISMFLNILAFAMNVVLNAVFIFGLFGAPKLGVQGVAVATSVSRLLQLVGCMLVSAREPEINLKLSLVFVRNKLLLTDFLKMALPALGNDVAWGLAFSMYSVILGHLGSDVVAANSIVTVVRNFGTVLCYGVASGGCILVGNILGEKRMEDARYAAKLVMRLTVITGLLGGAIVLLVMPLVMHFASISDTALGYLKIMMLINSYYIMGTAVNTTLIAGIFRAGGDSRFGLICDVIDMWCYAVPLGFLAAFVWKLPVMWVYFLLCTDEFVKWPWVIRNYVSGKWMKNITRENLEYE